MHPRDKPTKLGLALSGGGFRATIFHIGVLRRLAEMDLLREVNAISTVSGGSLTGAHYLLHLKKEIEEKGQLKREDYIGIVERMENEFRRGVRHNPRSRLFLNPFANLRIFCTAEAPGRRMASIYQRCFFRDVTDTLRGRAHEAGKGWRSGIPLRDMLITGKLDDIEAHNRWSPAARRTGPVENIPRLIFNASNLNSGQTFWFTAVEVGDPRLGFIRMDEIPLVKDCKQMLGQARGRTGAEAEAAHRAFLRAETRGDATSRAAIAGQLGGLKWYLRAEARLEREKKKPEAALDADPEPMEAGSGRERAQNDVATELNRRFDLSRRLMEAPFGLLRRVKISAWFLLDGKWEGRRGGYTREQHQERFWSGLAKIDKQLKERFFAAGEIHTDLLQFMLGLYLLRSARAFAWDVDRGLERLRLVDAAAASANFPPVFTPYHIQNLYDPETVRLVSLTDGGVHDNTGVKALLEEECTDIIASDVSGLFRPEASPRGDRFNMMNRIGGMLTAHVRDVQLDILHDRAEVSRAVWKHDDPEPKELEQYGLMSTPFFHMLSNPSDARVGPGGQLLDPEPVRPHPYARLIANLRTDLDVFGKIEIDALIYQGYQLADRFVRTHISEEAFPWINMYPPAIEKPETERGAGRVLKAGSKRLFRVIAIYSRAFAVIGAVAALVLFATMYLKHLSIADLLFQPLGAATATVREQTAFLGGYWQWPARACHWVLHSKGPLGLFCAGAFLFLFFTDGWERRLGRRISGWSGGSTRAQVWRLQASRVAGAWRRNVAWLVWLLPVWIALFGFAFCGILILSGMVTRTVTGRSSAPLFPPSQP